MEAFLDKREIIGGSSAGNIRHDRAPGTHDKAEGAERAARRVAFLRRENVRLAAAMDKAVSPAEEFTRTGCDLALLDWHCELFTGVNVRCPDHVRRYNRKLRSCSKYSLYREYVHDQAVQYVASHTCKGKLCQVCNVQNAKRMRRKYFEFFSGESFQGKKQHWYMNQLDFLHLTLTVPHSETGFRGKKIYTEFLDKAFNQMRKELWWKNAVVGGEQTIEFTRGENGFHIHIHALVMVRKGGGSRNKLHERILRHWNHVTVDENATRQAFTASDLEGIRKSLSYLDKERQDEIIHGWKKGRSRFKGLDPRGSTIIGLESLYVTEPDGRKRYVKTANKEDFMNGLMECLKYHFEPCSIKDPETGVYNTALIMDILPVIYGKRLYRKFGELHGVKALNVTATEEQADWEDLTVEYQDHICKEYGLPVFLEILEHHQAVQDSDTPRAALPGTLSQEAMFALTDIERADKERKRAEKAASEVVVHPYLSSIVDRSEYRYLLADPLTVATDGSRIRLTGKRLEVPGESVYDAINHITQRMIAWSLNHPL